MSDPIIAKKIREVYRHILKTVPNGCSGLDCDECILKQIHKNGQADAKNRAVSWDLCEVMRHLSKTKEE